MEARTITFGHILVVVIVVFAVAHKLVDVLVAVRNLVGHRVVGHKMIVVVAVFRNLIAVDCTVVLLFVHRKIVVGRMQVDHQQHQVAQFLSFF